MKACTKEQYRQFVSGKSLELVSTCTDIGGQFFGYPYMCTEYGLDGVTLAKVEHSKQNENEKWNITYFIDER